MGVQYKLLLPQLLLVVTHRESTPTAGGTTGRRKIEKVAQKYKTTMRQL